MTGDAGSGAEEVVEALARALGVEVAAPARARARARGGGPTAEPAPAADLDRALRPSVEHDRLTVDVPVQLWAASVLSARDALGFDYFDWLSAVDEQAAGFDVLVHLWSLRARTALLLRTRVAPDDPRLPSVADVFPGADWYERETYEMFGVVFDGHPRLERLILPDSVRGHPLRKDVLLASRVETPWPGTKEPGGESRRRPVLPPGVPEPGGSRRAGGEPA